MLRASLLTFAALAALAAGPVVAEEDMKGSAGDPGYAFYEKQAKDILRSAGVKVWECADDARKQGFYQFAIDQAERAIAFDPEQKEAREFLRYVRKDNKWVRDEAAWNSPGVPKQNVRPSNKNGVPEPEESFQKRMKKWEDESLAKANKFVAARYAELGEVCDSKGFPEQAKKGYEAAMRLDKDNAKARKGLGYTKFGKIWLTQKQEEARKTASKAEVVSEAETTVFEDLFGAKLNKVESAHFRIESPYSVEECQAYALACETAYAYYLADFGRDPNEEIWQRRLTFVVMQTEDQWNKFVDTYASDKEFTRQLSGCGAGPLLHGIRTQKQGSTPQGRTDQMVHSTVHTLNHMVWRLGPYAWLDEGLSYYYTVKVLETTATHCVALKKGDYSNQFKAEGGIKDWSQSDNWKPLMKSWVQAKNDTPLRTVMLQPIHNLQFEATVKGWSVASWMMDADRDRFMSLLSQLGDPTVKQADVIQNLFEMSIEDVEKLWQTYVLKCY